MKWGNSNKRSASAITHNRTGLAALVFLISGVVCAQTPAALDDFTSLMQRGEEALAAHRSDDAAFLFRNAVSLNPESAEAHLQLAASLIDGTPRIFILPDAVQERDIAARLEEAAREDKYALQLSPNNADALVGLAQATYRLAVVYRKFSGSTGFAEAKDLLEKAIAADPNNFQAHYALAQMIRGQFLSALPEAHTASPSGEARDHLRLTYGSLIDEGIEEAQKAVDLNPSSSAAAHEMSGLLRARSRLDESPEQSDADLQLSKDWQEKAMALAPKFSAHAVPRISTTREFSPEPTPALRALDTAGAVPIGSRAAEANLIKKVEPRYPSLAKAARIQGTVEFTVVIDENGKVQGTELIRGHPLLVNAAREAVMQWVYRPTLLSGNPVKVVTTVTVVFDLSSRPEDAPAPPAS